MAERTQHALITEQRIFVVKNFYQTNNKSETCRRFNEQFSREIKRDTVADIVDRFEESEQVGHLLLEQKKIKRLLNLTLQTIQRRQPGVPLLTLAFRKRRFCASNPN